MEAGMASHSRSSIRSLRFPTAPPSLVVLTALSLLFAPTPRLAAQSSEDAVADAFRFVYRDVRSNVLEAARRVPEADFAYRATPDVRSFGELLAHVADTQYFFCSAGLGEANPNEPDHRAGVVAAESLEARLRSRAEIVAAAEAALAYCDALYENARDEDVGRLMELGMAGQPRVRAMLLGIYHMARHYGNMVTYMRELGHVPPSSGL
jgi:uncharacterized damage-inducible protein DinB